MDQSLMGLLIGAVRTKKGIPLKTLSEGVCSVVNLNRIEAGERGADQLVLVSILWYSCRIVPSK